MPCPIYEVRVIPPGPKQTEPEVGVQCARPEPGVCPSCGLTPAYVGYNGCPKMLSTEDAAMLRLPPEVLHADPEPTIELPPGVSA